MRRYVLLVVVSLLFAVTPLFGQTLFVSTFQGGQVIRVDVASGQQTVIYQDSGFFLPEGVVVGPDNKVYVCDSIGGRVLRMNQDGSEVETVYRPQLFDDPYGFEGPSFLGADLFLNTRGLGVRHTGVWRIPGVAALAYGRNFPRPVLMLNRSQTGSEFGEGTTFTSQGDLLIVDRSNSRVLKSSPPYTAVNPFITSNLNEPFGVLVSGNEIWVASSGFQWNINRYDLASGRFLGTLANFFNGFPTFMDIDLAGNLYVTESGGNVWTRSSSGVWRFIASLSPEAVGISLGKTASCTITGRGQACLLEVIASDALGSRTPLILIHGWQLRGMPGDPLIGSWENFTNYFFLNQQLREKYKLYYFSYYSNEVNVPTLAFSLRDLIDQKGRADSVFDASPLVLLSHSMGGLISRSLMQQFRFRQGNWASRLAGERARLITLGTPHHGSPFANKEPRNAKVTGLFQASLNAVELAISPQPNEPNRSDLLWDNYDGLYEDKLYQLEPNEWLKTLNVSTVYDSKIIAYYGSIVVGQNCGTFLYCHGSTILGSAIGMASDGIVPVVSAAFYNGTITQGSPRVLTRPIQNHNHEEMASGKGDNVLFNRIRDDLLGAATTASLKVTVVGSGTVTTNPAGTTFAAGTVVNLIPQPSANSVFAGFGGDSDCLDGQITANGNVSCTAYFETKLGIAATAGTIDFNGDGRSDSFRYKPSTGEWAIDFADASNNLHAKSGSWSPNLSVFAADFDGNGLADLFLYNTQTGAWTKAINNGLGDFAYSNGSWDPGWNVYVAELNGDGKSDVFLYNPATGAWFKCLSLGLGTGEFVYYSGMWSPRWQLYPADFNADRRTDFFLYNTGSGQWFVATNDGSASFSYQNGAWSAGWQIYPADFNADARSDLFLYNNTTGVWFVVSNTGSDFSYKSGAWSAGWSINIADFDGNGRSDLFLYNRQTGQWFEVITQSTGEFGYVSGTWPPGFEVIVTDLNADRKSDLLLNNRQTGVFQVQINTGLGSFVSGAGNIGSGWNILTSR